MSKYNLTDILKEYVGGGRIGTLNISFKELSDKMDDLEATGKYVIRRMEGPSGDGKVTNQFEVVAIDKAVPGGKKQEDGFTVYDYKFGFDPSEDEKAFEEYPFSVGGYDFDLAAELLGAEKFGISESKKPSQLTPDEQKELKFHIQQFKKGNIDRDDLLTVFDQFGLGDHWNRDMLSVDEDLFSPDSGTEDNVDNIDKVASPSAKGKGYSSAVGAERSEDDKEQSDITQTTKPMYEDMNLISLAKKLGIDIDDLKDRVSKMKSKEKDEIEASAKKAMAENGNVDDYAEELKEAVAEEESVADYLMDYYRNPNKPEETMVDEKIVGEYFETHEDWDLIWGKSYEEGLQDFEEFFDINYGIMFPSAGDIDEDLKKHFKRFM